MQTDGSSVNEDPDLNHCAVIEPLVDVVNDRVKNKWTSSQNKPDWKSMEEDLVPAFGMIRGKPLIRIEVFSKIACDYGKSRFSDIEQLGQINTQKKGKDQQTKKENQRVQE